MNVGVSTRHAPPDTISPSDHFGSSLPYLDSSACLSSSPSARCGSEALRSGPCRPAISSRQRSALLGAQRAEPSFQEWEVIFNGDLEDGREGEEGEKEKGREEDDDGDDVPWETISSRLRQQLNQVLQKQKAQHFQMSQARLHDGYHHERHSATLGGQARCGAAPPQQHSQEPPQSRGESQYRSSGGRGVTGEGCNREDSDWLVQASMDGRAKQANRRPSNRRSLDCARSFGNIVTEIVPVSGSSSGSGCGPANPDGSRHSSPVPLQQRRRSHSEVPLLVTVPKSSLERFALLNKKGSPPLPPSLRQGFPSPPVRQPSCASPNTSSTSNGAHSTPSSGNSSGSDRRTRGKPSSLSPPNNHSAHGLHPSALSPDSLRSPPSASASGRPAVPAAGLALPRRTDGSREDLDSSDEEFLAAYCAGSPTAPDRIPAAESPLSSPLTSPPSAFQDSPSRALRKSASCLEGRGSGQRDGRGEQRRAPQRAQTCRAQAPSSAKAASPRAKGKASGAASGARNAAQDASGRAQRPYKAQQAAPSAASLAKQSLEQQKHHLEKQLQQAKQLRAKISGGGFRGSSGFDGANREREAGQDLGGKRTGGAATHPARSTGGTGGASTAVPRPMFRSSTDRDNNGRIEGARHSGSRDPYSADCPSRGHADTPAGGAVSSGRNLFDVGSQSQRALPRAATVAVGALARGRSWASIEFQLEKEEPQQAPQHAELVSFTKNNFTFDSGTNGGGFGGGSGKDSMKSGNGSHHRRRSDAVSNGANSAVHSATSSPRSRTAAPAATGRTSSAAAGGLSQGSADLSRSCAGGLADSFALRANGQPASAVPPAVKGLFRTSSARQLSVRKMLLDLTVQSDRSSEGSSGSGHASPSVASEGGSGIAGRGARRGGDAGGSGTGGNRSLLSRRGSLNRSASSKEDRNRRSAATAQECADEGDLGEVRRSASARYQGPSRLSVDLSAVSGRLVAGDAGEFGGSASAVGAVAEAERMRGYGGGASAGGKPLGRSASDWTMQNSRPRMLDLPTISGAVAGAPAVTSTVKSTAVRNKSRSVDKNVGDLAEPAGGPSDGDDFDDEDLFDILEAIRNKQTSPDSPTPISPSLPCPIRSPVAFSPSPTASARFPFPHSRSSSPSRQAPAQFSRPVSPLIHSPNPILVTHNNVVSTRSLLKNIGTFHHSQRYPCNLTPSSESPIRSPPLSPRRSPPLSPRGSSVASSPRSPQLTPPHHRHNSLTIHPNSSALGHPRRHSTCGDQPINLTHPVSRVSNGRCPFGSSPSAADALRLSRSHNARSSAAVAAAAAVEATAGRNFQAGAGFDRSGGSGSRGRMQIGGGDSGDSGGRLLGRARTQPAEREFNGRGR